MPKVFVVQESPGKNLLGAERYGQMIYMFSADRQMNQNNYENVKEVIQHILKDYKKEDYIIPIGDPAIIGLVCGIIMLENKQLNILKWDRQRSEYYVIEMVL